MARPTYRPGTAEQVFVRLGHHEGRLHVPNSAIYEQQARDNFDGEDSLLIRCYSAGDCDVVPWPRPGSDDPYWTPAKWLDCLICALCDEIETGVLAPDTRCVLLPDGVAIDLSTGTLYCAECDTDACDGHATWCTRYEQTFQTREGL